MRVLTAHRPYTESSSDEGDWRSRAACTQVSPDLFFPTGNFPSLTARMAKRVCASCPVRAECEEEHAGERYGIFFGTTPRERGFKVKGWEKE